VRVEEEVEIPDYYRFNWLLASLLCKGRLSDAEQPQLQLHLERRGLT